jgi:hypothetical protein
LKRIAERGIALGGSETKIPTYFDRTNRQDFELGETRDTFDVDFVQHLRTYGQQELTWGLGARVSPSQFIQSSQGVNFLPAKQVDSVYSGFVQYELPIVRDKLTLTAGTKLEHNNFSGFDYQPSVRLFGRQRSISHSGLQSHGPCGHLRGWTPMCSSISFKKTSWCPSPKLYPCGKSRNFLSRQLGESLDGLRGKIVSLGRAYRGYLYIKDGRRSAFRTALSVRLRRAVVAVM